MRILIVTAVQAEADAIGPIENAQIIVSGIGRTNAAAATTEAIIKDGPFDYVLSVGLAGSLPGGELEIGDIGVA
ncbi:MAG: futalosine hydrolase, partial [Planctomycetes bacterium]|nr:futalosine hydrolase [Planctomycetota bacterium]